jgi:hypothetical protein
MYPGQIRSRDSHPPSQCLNPLFYFLHLRFLSVAMPPAAPKNRIQRKGWHWQKYFCFSCHFACHFASVWTYFEWSRRRGGVNWKLTPAGFNRTNPARVHGRKVFRNLYIARLLFISKGYCYCVRLKKNKCRKMSLKNVFEKYAFWWHFFLNDSAYGAFTQSKTLAICRMARHTKIGLILF